MTLTYNTIKPINLNAKKKIKLKTFQRNFILIQIARSIYQSKQYKT